MSTATTAQLPGSAPNRRTVLITTAATLAAVDIATKIAAVELLRPGHPVHLLGDRVTWVLVRNGGAALSMAQGYTWALTVIVGIITAALLWRGGRTGSGLVAVATGLIVGGALGNLVDRVFRAPGPLHGAVVDFVAIGWSPAFNAADLGIVVGAALMLLRSLAGASAVCGR